MMLWKMILSSTQIAKERGNGQLPIGRKDDLMMDWIEIK